MMTRKPGPPVPPRPNTGLLKSLSESPTSRMIVTTTATTTTTKLTSSNSGRTVIYKSPSFDLKKRQLQQQKYLSQEDNSQDEINKQERSQHQNQTFTNTLKQHSTLVSKNDKNLKSNYTQNDSSIHGPLDNDTAVIGNKTNRTEIVIINKNNKTTIKNVTDSDNNNVLLNIDHDNRKVDKISPVPKPRTVVPMKAIGANNNNSEASIIKCGTGNNDHDRNLLKSEITINNNVPNNNSNSNSNNNNKTIEIKNLEIEKNLKNAAERLFTEIIINQSKINDQDHTSKTEHCISVCSTPSPRLDGSKFKNNCNKTRVNLLKRPEPEGDENKSFNLIKDQKKMEDKIPVEKKVAFHEILISELTAMRNKCSKEIANFNDHDLNDDDGHHHHHHHHNDNEDHDDDRADNKKQDQKEKQRKRYPSGCSTDSSPYGTQRSRIRTSDWVEVGDNGKEVMLSSCHISLEDSGLEDEERLDDTSSGVGDSWDSVKDAEERMSLPGLPPLPKSLSGLDSSGVPIHNSTGSLASLESQRGISPLSRMTATTAGGTANTTTLDTQLAVLRREMFGLRQLDLSLLSQLWALNESIQEFRTMLQEQETLSPPSPSPSPSDANSVSSDGEDETPTMGKLQQLPPSLQRMRSAPPPPPPTRKAPQRPV